MLLSKFSTSLFKVTEVLGAGDNGNYYLENTLPLSTFYILELYNNVNIFLPNFVTNATWMVDGINVYIRTAGGKTARVYGTNNTTAQRIYDIGSGNGAAKESVVVNVNQNSHFIYYAKYWYLMD